jgi:hypothetical protein
LVWSLCYLVFRCVLQVVLLRPRSEDFKELEHARAVEPARGVGVGHHVDALRLQLGLLGRAGDVDVDGHRHFRMKRNPDVLDADRLDRPVEDDLVLGDLVALRFEPGLDYSTARCRLGSTT